jgi:hypothetical protein
MQRKIISGIPYYVDTSNKLYTWDTEAQPQPIGTYNPTADAVTFESNHFERLTSRLEDWRSKQQPRDRKAIANSRRNTRGKAAKSTEDLEDDE